MSSSNAAALTARKGDRFVHTLSAGVDLTGLALTLTLRARGAASDAITPVALVNDPGTGGTAVLTLPPAVTTTLAPLTQYWYKVLTSDGIPLAEGPFYVLPTWPQ